MSTKSPLPIVIFAWLFQRLLLLNTLKPKPSSFLLNKGLCLQVLARGPTIHPMHEPEDLGAGHYIPF